MSFAHLRPRGFTRVCVGKHGGHHGGSRVLPVGVPYGFMGGWGGYDYDTMPPYTQINVYPPPEEGVTTVQSGPGTYGHVAGRTRQARVGDPVTMPVGPQDQGVFINAYWQQLNTAFQTCTVNTPAGVDTPPNVTSTRLSPQDISNFSADFQDWTNWFAAESTLSGPQGAMRIALPGHSSNEPGIALGAMDLPALNGWWQKALGWRAVFAQKCTGVSLPADAPAGTGMLSGVNRSLSGVTSLLENVAVIGALGVALWFFWPMIAGARGVAKVAA